MVVELPQEIIDNIIDEIALDLSRYTWDQIQDLKALSLVSPAWQHRSRTHLFQALEITSDNFPIWCRDVRLGSDGPSRFVTYIRYRPSWLEAERNIGPLEGLSCSPSNMSAFANLRTLHFADISLRHTRYLTSFGGLIPNVRELWLEDCQMDITRFVSFVRPFTKLERLRLMRPQCPNENKLQQWDMAEPLLLNGTLEYHQPDVAASPNIGSFIQEFSLLPTSFNTVVFRGRLETPTAVNRLLAASRKALTKLTFGHNTVAEGLSLKPLGSLKELELSTLFIELLPRVLRSIKSRKLERIRFFLLINQHQLEYGVEHRVQKSWTQLDIELCALANRLQAARGYGGGDLQVKFMDLDPTIPPWLVETVSRTYFPRSHEHRYISVSVG